MPDSKERILLVEDSDEWTSKVEAAARDVGAVVVRVSKYNEAIQTMQHEIGRFDLAILDSRLSDNRSKLSRLVQFIEEREGYKPSSMALTQFPGDISKVTRKRLIAALDKSAVVLKPQTLKRTIVQCLRRNAYIQGRWWWMKNVRRVPPPNTGAKLVRNFQFALTLVSPRCRGRGIILQRKLERHWHSEPRPIFDCAGYILDTFDDSVEVNLEIEPGKKIMRSFPVTRIKKAGLLFSGATFRYQVFEEPNGDVRSHFEPWSFAPAEPIVYDKSLFSAFDATKP